MGCATATIKYLVFLFNALCALIGIGVIVVSSLALGDDVIDSNSRNIYILFIVIGSVVFLISFFGCCGVIKENICLTWLYAVILVVLLILTCVLSFVYLKNIVPSTNAEKELNNLWQQQKNGTNAMDVVQHTLDCCGVNGPNDYTQAKLTIPQSCYSSGNTTSTISNQILNKDGCLTKLTETYENALKFVRVFSYILIGVEGVALLCASILAITFSNEQRRSRY